MDWGLLHSPFVLGYLLKDEADRHNQIISSGSLIDLIQLHCELRLEQHLLPGRVRDFCDDNQGHRDNNAVEAPTVGAMRHRLTTDLRNAGCSLELTTVLRIPEEYLPSLLDQLSRAVEYLQFKLLEVEARLIDEPPINPQEARAKATILIELMKEEPEFDPTLFAFSLEECIAMLSR